MNQYMLLIRNVGNPMEGLSEEEAGAHMQKWGAWMGGLGEQGKLDGGLPFNAASTAILSDNGNTTTNGVHVEPNGMSVGGYVLIKAASLDEAIEISKGCPALESASGTIEVKECLPMS